VGEKPLQLAASWQPTPWLKLMLFLTTGSLWRVVQWLCPPYGYSSCSTEESAAELVILNSHFIIYYYTLSY